jgi:hypothetical protein
MSRHDSVWLPGTFSESGLCQIKAQPGLARRRVRTMAAETVARKYRLHILIEVKVLRGLGWTRMKKVAFATRHREHNRSNSEDRNRAVDSRVAPHFLQSESFHRHPKRNFRL